VNRLKPRELCEDVAKKPEKPLGFADRTQWNFEVPRAPFTFLLPTRQGESEPNPIDIRFERGGLRPKLVNERIGDGSRESRPDALMKRRERRFVVHRQILIGDFAAPFVEREALDLEVPVSIIARDAKRGGLRDIVIDDQVEPPSLVTAGEGCNSEILDPDPRVKGLWLVACHDQVSAAVGWLMKVDT
jgi:hypothetical protein